MTGILEEYFVVILLGLFGGVLFWAFRPKNRKKSTTTDDVLK